MLAHEIGHFFGLDHSQLDGTQGLASNNYVLMYPIAYRSLQTLHEDDIAAVTSLYPTANVGSTYGQLNGTFTTAGGTPILGANIWARETSTGKVYSVVSDFLTQGNGYFRLYLPAGDVHAECRVDRHQFHRRLERRSLCGDRRATLRSRRRIRSRRWPWAEERRSRS